tara:strand:- start:1600 stop:2130 length:531 start_codon:yes stop_codon:yes gene_type:complete
VIKKHLIFFIVIFFFTNSNNLLNAQDNIAFIDLNAVFDNSQAGKKINKEVKNKRVKNNDEFKKFKEEIDIKRNKLIAQKNVLAKEEFKKKIIELEKNIKKMNQSLKKKNDDLTKFQIKARSEFFINLRPILEEYSKNNEISIILKKKDILIGKTSLDISKNILDLFDKKIKKLVIK